MRRALLKALLEAEEERTRAAYLRLPDSADDAGDWSNAEEFKAERRLVLLLSRTSAYSYLNKFLVADITTTIRGIAQEVRIGKRCAPCPALPSPKRPANSPPPATSKPSGLWATPWVGSN